MESFGPQHNSYNIHINDNCSYDPMSKQYYYSINKFENLIFLMFKSAYRRVFVSFKVHAENRENRMLILKIFSTICSVVLTLNSNSKYNQLKCSAHYEEMEKITTFSGKCRM